MSHSILKCFSVDAVTQLKSDASAKFAKGLFAAALADLDAALAAFHNELASTSPDEQAARASRSTWTHNTEARGRPRQASTGPCDEHGQLKYAILCNKSAVLLEMGLAEISEQSAQEAIALQPQRPKAYFRKVKATLACGRVSQASASLALALSMFPHDPHLTKLRHVLTRPTSPALTSSQPPLLAPKRPRPPPTTDPASAARPRSHDSAHAHKSDAPPSKRARRGVPVTVLSGFLGAGKTTLLRRLLTTLHGLRIAVLVNDMNELNVDAHLVRSVWPPASPAAGTAESPKPGERSRNAGSHAGTPTVDRSAGRAHVDAAEGIVELSNGCICCTLRDDFVAHVGRLVQRGLYDYLLIESTGIGEPLPVAAALCAAEEDAEAGAGPVAEDQEAHEHGHAAAPHRPAVTSPSDDSDIAQLAAVREEAAEVEGVKNGRVDVSGCGVNGEEAKSAAPRIAAEAEAAGAGGRVFVDTMVTVVDASSFVEYMQDGSGASFAQLLTEQVEFADVIIVNKVDLIDAQQLRDIEALVRALNPKARIIPTRFCDVSASEIVNTGSFDLQAAAEAPGWAQELLGNAHASESDTYGFASHLYTAERPFHPHRLLCALTQTGCLHPGGSGGCAALLHSSAAPPAAGSDSTYVGVHGFPAGGLAATSGNEAASEEASPAKFDANKPGAAVCGAERLVECRQNAERNGPEEGALQAGPGSVAAANDSQPCGTGPGGLFEHVLRSKGFFWLACAPRTVFEWSLAGRQLRLRPYGTSTLSSGEALRQRVVFIGQRPPWRAISAALDDCLLTQDELALPAEHWAPFMDLWEPFLAGAAAE